VNVAETRLGVSRPPFSEDQILPRMIATHAAATPSRPFLADVSGRSLTYAEAHAAALRWAAAYQQVGVGAGDRVAIMLPPSIEGYLAWLGLAWLRAIEVPLNVDYRGRMLNYALANSGARVVVVSRGQLDNVAAALGDQAKVDVFVVLGAAQQPAPAQPYQVLDVGQFLEAAAELAADLPGPQAWDISCVMYTSGTTGPSKGVLVPWRELYEFPASMPADVLQPGESMYACWPLFHASGKTMIYATALAGGGIVLRDRFSISAFWSDIAHFDCAFACLPSSIAQLLLTQPEDAADPATPLRSVVVAPLFEQVEEFKRRFNVRVTSHYGMTEIGMPFWLGGWEIPNCRTCGRVRPGYEARLVDPFDYPVAPGEVGELIVRSDEPWMLNAGYLEMPEQTATAWRNGWFHTGDAFRSDADGWFYFVDRFKDTIRRRGENISSFEVEAYVREHPDVRDCAAVAVPSELSEDEVKVCVVLEPEHTLEAADLVGFLIERMPRFMIPRYVEFMLDLPRTDTQKIRKVELRSRGINEHTWDRDAAGVVLPRQNQ
jgi:crotonobetaine/carnitine-CoA ligase